MATRATRVAGFGTSFRRELVRGAAVAVLRMSSVAPCCRPSIESSRDRSVWDSFIALIESCTWTRTARPWAFAEKSISWIHGVYWL